MFCFKRKRFSVQGKMTTNLDIKDVSGKPPTYMGRVVCTQPQGSCFLAYNICCYQIIRNRILHAGMKQVEIIIDIY